MHTTSAVLTPKAPFDFAHSLNFVSHFTPAMGEQRTTDTTLTKATSFNGQTIVFQVTSTGTPDAPQLAVTLFSETPIADSTRQAALDRVGFYLSIDDDMQAFYALADGDPAFEGLIQRLYGYHQVKFLTAFENACWALLSQRIPMSTAANSKRKLTERFGGCLTVDGVMYRTFPEPAQLLVVPPDELTAMTYTAKKSAYLVGAARAFDDVDEAFLRTGDFDAVEGWLRSIKGIGEWSARFVMIRALGRMERTSLQEKRLLEAAEKLYGQPVTFDDITRLAARYGVWQGYWAHYLRAGVG